MRKWMPAIYFIGVLILASVVSAATARYIDAPPMAQAVNQPVGEVKKSDTVQVPIITWGGDIATIYGNGNASLTVKGSVFDKLGLKLKLVREDDFSKQLASYLKGESPYLRGTMGMINQAIEAASADPRTKPFVVYQMTWSVGGDALAVKDGIKTPKDLKGKTVAVQAYGPHVDYLAKILDSAGLSIKDVKIKWTKELTGKDNTPVAAFRIKKKDANNKDNLDYVDAAMVISPDAMALTSGGKVGTGSEDSVRGARIMLTTKTGNRIIPDVYVVRADYLEANRDKVEKFVGGLMLAEEALRKVFQEKQSQPVAYQQMITAAADILLDSSQAVSDAEGLYADAEFVGYKGNVKFFGDPNYPRNMDKLTGEIQSSLAALGLLSKRVSLSHARWDYNKLKAGLTNTAGVEAPRFVEAEVAKVVTQKQQQGTLAEGQLFSFEIYFQPNQNAFTSDLYVDAFKKAVELAATYGGAVITVEGHSDPLGYLRAKKGATPQVALERMKQAAKNLSLSRASAVRDNLIQFAKKNGVNLDPTQFATVGHGIVQPKNGMCGEDPCAPKSEQEWRNNMRVEFRIIQIEAEASVFKPVQ